MQRNRATLSREEQELIDVERQMEEQLVQQHMELERVVAVRTEPNTEGGVGYLCKWRGLPYSEATWENKDLIQKIDNGLKMAEAYQVFLTFVRGQRLLSPLSVSAYHISKDPQLLGRSRGVHNCHQLFCTTVEGPDSLFVPLL